MRPILTTLTILFGILFLLCSCQNDIEDAPDSNESGKVTVAFRVSPYQQVPFENDHYTFGDIRNTRASSLSSLCKYLLLAVYDSKDNLDTLIVQQSDDKSFGTFPLGLHHGTYRFVVLAHSSDKQPKMNTPIRIDFGEKNMSDVLYWSERLKVGKDSLVEVSLHRAVAKVEIVSTDTLSTKASQVYVWFSGGTYAFNAVTGTSTRSIDDSKTIQLSEDEKGKPLSVSFYTFPIGKDTTSLKELQINVSAQKNILESKTLKNVPIKANMITRLTGRLVQ